MGSEDSVMGDMLSFEWGRGMIVYAEMDEDMETPENIAIDKDEPVCPKCDSFDVYYEKYSRRAVFASWLLLGIPLPFLKRKWRCKGCSYEWKD